MPLRIVHIGHAWNTNRRPMPGRVITTGRRVQWAQRAAPLEPCRGGRPARPVPPVAAGVPPAATGLVTAQQNDRGGPRTALLQLFTGETAQCRTHDPGRSGSGGAQGSQCIHKRNVGAFSKRRFRSVRPLCDQRQEGRLSELEPRTNLHIRRAH